MIRRPLAVALLVAAPAAAQLRVEKPADLAAPIVLGPGQGAIVVGFRRPDAQSAGKSGLFAFGRYDVDKRDLILQPRDTKKNGETTTYSVSVRSADRKATYEVAVMLVSAGDYVATGGMPGPGAQLTNSFCLGAPTFRVEPGAVVYFGDVTPYFGAKMRTGEVGTTGYAPGLAMAYSSHPDEARAALKGQPALASALTPAALRDGATYACYGISMIAYELPGVPALPPAAPPPDAAAAPATP